MAERRTTDVEDLIAQAVGLRRLAVRLVGESDADDIVQDAILAGMQHAPREGSALRPWLVRVVRNFASGRHRSEGHRAARESDVARGEALPSAAEMVERMEVQRIVAEEVLQLAEPYRRAVLALHFEGVSAEDYARGIGVPGATVRSWSKRGLDTLRTRLDKRFGGERSAWSACLLSLVRPEAALVPALIVGGIAVKKAVAAAAAVLLFASLVWWAASSGALESSSGNQNASALFVAQNPGLEPPLANPVTAVREDRSPVEVSRADKFGIVTGRVVWMPERTPAVGIGIRLARQPQLLAIGPPDQVLTDDEGRFRFEHLVPGKFDVRLDRAQVKRSLDVIAGSTIDFELEVPRGRDVVGRVMDREGNPVAGAEIWMGESNSQWSREVGRSAGDGTYRIEGVDGWTSAFARLPGFAPSGAQQFVTWPREDGSPQIFDLYLGWAAGRIAGRVVDSFGNPCVDAWVEVGDVSDGGGVDPAGERMMRRKPEFVRTREDGSFEVGDLAVGPHDIHVRAPGHPALSREVIVASGLVARVEFALPRSSRVFGRVTNPSGGPVEGADVTMTNVEAGSTVKLGSDPAGRFDSGTVAAGRTRLTVKHKIGRKVELDVDLEPGSTFEWSPQLGAFAAIRARIVDAKGRPVPGVVVSCTARSKLNATSDAEGRVVFEAMPDRACMLLIVENEQVCMRQSSVRPGEPEIDCVYEVPSAYVVGRLVEADGTPGRGQFLDVDHVRAKTDDDGRFEVGPLHPGSYELRMSGQNLRRFTPRDFELHAGEVLDLGVVKCSDVGSLHVQARSSEGVPIGWVTPTVRQVDRWNGWLHKRGWNDRGEWLVDDLPAGEYELTTTGAGVATEVRRFVVESRKRTELEVDLRFGAPVRVLVHVDKSSTRLQGLTIIVRRTEGTHPLERTWDWKFAEPVGDFDFSLREGRYEITATAHDGRKGKAWVDVPRAGSPRTDVAIELR